MSVFDASVGSATKAIATQPIGAQIEYLEQNLGALQKVLEELSTRIAPVVRTIDPVNSPVFDTKSVSAYGKRLEIVNRTLELVITAIGDLTVRIDI